MSERVLSVAVTEGNPWGTQGSASPALRAPLTESAAKEKPASSAKIRVMHLQSAFPKTASRQKSPRCAFASSGNRPARRAASRVWAHRRKSCVGLICYADHLGTPRAITRPSDNAKVWEWKNDEPFGANAPNENPSGAGAFTFNLRFPGQYYDAETGTHFNWNRDYDPGSGRYIQSDPDGIDAGNNTFSYVNGNPLKFVDPDGLQIALPVPALVPGGNNNACFACRKPKSDPYGLGLSDDESAPTFSLPNLDLNMAPPLLILVIGGASLMAAPGNQADTQITGDYGRAASDAKLKNCPPPDRCKWLEENASRYRPDQVKATQKAWGCRGSRPGKDKIKR